MCTSTCCGLFTSSVHWAWFPPTVKVCPSKLFSLFNVCSIRWFHWQQNVHSFGALAPYYYCNTLRLAISSHQNLSQVHRISIKICIIATIYGCQLWFHNFYRFLSLPVFKWIITQQTSAIIFKSGFHKCAYMHEAIDLTQATMSLDNHLST